MKLPNKTRRKILDNLEEKKSSEEPIIVAGASLGGLANCAEEGGADMILTYNAGRFRMMGIGSMAGLLPYKDANQFNLKIASEIEKAVNIPIITGVYAPDPFRNKKNVLRNVKDAGLSGVINFPTASMMDGSFRENVEGQNLGYNHEVEMIKTAKEMDLLTSPYVFNIEETQKMVEAGADIIIAHVGYRKPPLDLEEAIEKLNEIKNAKDEINSDTILLAHGGPILDPEAFEKVYTETEVDGFMGFSALVRLPAENAVENQVSKFKSIKK